MQQTEINSGVHAIRVEGARRQVERNARHLGGLERALEKSSWQGRTLPGEEFGEGFARYTCAPEGGSSVPLEDMASDWSQIQDLRSHPNFAGKPDSAFGDFYKKVRRWLRKDPSPLECRQALAAGKNWRNILPKGNA